LARFPCPTAANDRVTAADALVKLDRLDGWRRSPVTALGDRAGRAWAREAVTAMGRAAEAMCSSRARRCDVRPDGCGPDGRVCEALRGSMGRTGLARLVKGATLAAGGHGLDGRA
jgi:hypothetical protein